MGKSTFRSETQISRVTRSKEEAKAVYDKTARWYDVLAGFCEKKIRDVGLSKLGVEEGERVLEIGYGPGHTLKALAQSVGSSGKAHGIDLSQGMFNTTRARLRKAGLLERVVLKCGDAATLPYETNFFDAIFMSFTLELFDTSEIPTILHECYRVLRIDGRICVIALLKKEKPSWMLRLYEWAHRKFPYYIDCRPIFLHKTLENFGFEASDATEMSLWGLPCEVVVAWKTKSD